MIPVGDFNTESEELEQNSKEIHSETETNETNNVFNN